MTKKILTISIVFLSLSVWGQKKIENKLTNEHVGIEGTKISLIPSEGFISGVNFLGLKHKENGSTIAVFNLPVPFTEITKGLTKEAFEQKGVNVKKIENLTINGLPGIFITGSQEGTGKVYMKFILYFGSNEESIILNGISPIDLKKAGADVKKSMLTVFYDESKIIDPLASAGYSIDVSETKLIFATNVANNFIYTVDGQHPTKLTDKTNLIIMKTLSPETQEDIKISSIKALHSTTAEIEKIDYIEEITLDGFKGYEILAKGKNKKTGEPETIYLVTVVKKTLYNFLLGTTNDTIDESINEIKKAVLTFKRI